MFTRIRIGTISIAVMLSFLLLGPFNWSISAYDDMYDDPSIIVRFDNEGLRKQMSPDLNLTEPITILWYARHTNGIVLWIDILLIHRNKPVTYTLAKGINNTGAFLWSLRNPSVEDADDYFLKIFAYTSVMHYSANVTDFTFTVYHKKCPRIESISLPAGEEYSGEMEVRWKVKDPDTSPYLISSEVLLSNDGGEDLYLVYSFREDPGCCLIDTRRFENGYKYRIEIRARDDDGLKGSRMSQVFSIYNNHIPGVNFVSHEDGGRIGPGTNISWSAADSEEGSAALLVDLWYVVRSTGERVNLLSRAANMGYFVMRNESIVPSGEGHLLGVQVEDSRGALSYRDVIEVWSFGDGDEIFLQPVFTRLPVDESFRVVWDTYLPAEKLASELLLTVHHRRPGQDWDVYQRDLPDLGEFTLDTADLSEGAHSLRLVLADPLDPTISDELLIENIQVSHYRKPEMLVRECPGAGSYVGAEVEFTVVAYDPNGDPLGYLGYYEEPGGEWTLFDSAHGGSKHTLRWNTTDLEPGSYLVRIVVYDGSFHNLSESRTVGPYLIYDTQWRSSYWAGSGQKENDDQPLLLVLISILGLIMVTLVVFGFFYIRSRKKLGRDDMKKVGLSPAYSNAFFSRKGEGQLNERLLPAPGGTSGRTWLSDSDDGSRGTIILDTAEQELLEMFDPDIVTDIGPSDLDSYMVLGVSSTAGSEEIRNSYLRHVRMFHPDRFPGSDRPIQKRALEELKKKNRAKTILLNPQKRALLDRMIREDETRAIRGSSVKSVDQLRMLAIHNSR
ncbi:MAG: J domain-containing protein [Thermoplasmatota archaeon]